MVTDPDNDCRNQGRRCVQARIPIAERCRTSAKAALDASRIAYAETVGGVPAGAESLRIIRELGRLGIISRILAFDAIRWSTIAFLANEYANSEMCREALAGED